MKCKFGLMTWQDKRLTDSIYSKFCQLKKALDDKMLQVIDCLMVFTFSKQVEGILVLL